MIAHADRLLGVVERLLMACGALVLVVMMLHICAESVLRASGASMTLNTLTIVSAWYMVAVIFLPLPQTGAISGHLAVDLVAEQFPPRMRRLTDHVVALFSAGYFGLLAWLTLAEAIHQTQADEIWETSVGYLPVWPARWVLPVAFGVMALRELLRFIRPQVTPDLETPERGEEA